MEAMIIAIDGPAASGKGTLGKRLAAHYRFRHLDTGLLYRAVAKAVLDAALESSLAEGLRLEKHAFAALFDTADQKEGMAAFREKRAPDFTNR